MLVFDRRNHIKGFMLFVADDTRCFAKPLLLNFSEIYST